MIKKFFWKDLSGRGAHSNLTLEQLVQINHDDPGHDGILMADWAKTAEEGDTWNSNAVQVTCIENSPLLN